MKVFVDTSVWINYLRGDGSDKVTHLASLVDSGQPIYSLPVVAQEIIQGLKHDKDVPNHIEKLESLNFCPFNFHDAVEAARLYRLLRKQGITATTIDLQIASVCIRNELHLLSSDKDFLNIAKKISLSII